MNVHERASSRAHAHHEGVVHLNRGGWYTHAAGVGWFLRRILASPVIARNEVKLTAYTPSLLRFWMPRRFARGPYALLLSAMHSMHSRLTRGKFMMAWFVFIKGKRLKIVDLTDKVDDFNFWYVLQVRKIQHCVCTLSLPKFYRFLRKTEEFIRIAKWPIRQRDIHFAAILPHWINKNIIPAWTSLGNFARYNKVKPRLYFIGCSRSVGIFT